jgi:hypothetical protein
MTDKELLELAAKAAGIEYDFCRPELGGCQIRKPFVSGFWNPLTDDGDALRLAVKLSLLIAPIAYEPGINAYGAIGVSWHGQRYKFDYEHFTNDPYAATRRAITRAAAEIGKAMP